MTLGQGLRMALSASPLALVAAAVVTAPTVVLEGHARWWGLLAGLVLLGLAVAAVGRSLKRRTTRGSSFGTTGRTTSFVTSAKVGDEVTSRPLPADFDPDAWMARATRQAKTVNRVAFALLLLGLVLGVGLGVALDSAIVSILAGAVGLLLGMASGAVWAWAWFRSASRLSSG